MIYALEYDFTEVLEHNLGSDFKYVTSDTVITYPVRSMDIKLEDYQAFEFEKKYGYEYSSPRVGIEPGAKELMKDIETKYLNNTLDEYTYARDEKFIEFLKKRFENDAYAYVYANARDDIDSNKNDDEPFTEKKNGEEHEFLIDECFN